MTTTRFLPVCGHKSKDRWISIAELLSCEVATVSEIATAIEYDSVTVFDEFDRRLRATDGPEEDPLSKKCALKQLADYYQAVVYENTPPDDEYLDRIEAKYLSDGPLLGLLRSFGWCISELPNFEAEFKDERPQDNNEEPHPNAIRNYNRLIKILAAMAKLDLSEPYKAAQVVLKHADINGLPAPKKPDTFQERLEEAAKTD